MRSFGQTGPKEFNNIMLCGNISFCMVFQARVLLDLHMVIGSSIKDAYQKLRQQAANAYDALSIRWESKSVNDRRTLLVREICNHSDNQKLLREWGSHKILFEVNMISLFISEVIGTNNWVQNKATIVALDSYNPREPQSAHPDLPRKCICYKAQVIFMPRYPAFIQNQNPVYCGLESLRCAINVERASVLYDNATYSFACVAHLYNVAKQLGLLKGHLDGLERVMNVHVGTLFNGELPSTGLQMSRRFLIRMKFPATTFARNSGSQGPKSDARLAKLEHIFEFPEIFRACGKHLNGEDTAERFLCNIAQLRQLRNKVGLRRVDSDSVEMLKQVRDAIQKKMPTIDAGLMTTKIGTSTLSS
jgi:hypothetical protein